MVIVGGNGHGKSNSNPDEAVCILDNGNNLGEGMNPIILFPIFGE